MLGAVCATEVFLCADGPSSCSCGPRLAWALLCDSSCSAARKGVCQSAHTLCCQQYLRCMRVCTAASLSSRPCPRSNPRSSCAHSLAWAWPRRRHNQLQFQFSRSASSLAAATCPGQVQSMPHRSGKGREAHQAAGGDEALLHERGQRRLAVEGMPPCEAYERRMPRHPAARQAQHASAW